MNYRKLAAIAAVLTMMTSAVSCGSDADGGDADTTSAVAVDGTTEAAEAATTTGTGTATTSKNSDKVTTAKTTTTKSAKTTTTAKAGGSSSGGTTVGGNSSGGSSGGAKTTQAASGGGSSTQETTSAGEEKVYDAEVTLGSTPKVTGSNVTVDGSVVTITAGGDYIFSGTMSNGQIRVNVPGDEDNVTVVLNGVDISNPTAPAIFIEDAKKCTIKPKEGSVNYLSSDCEKKGNKEAGAIFSNDTVRLKGNGTLNITATAAHGINSDDDVIVESGTYKIDSRKSGIIANDEVTVNDGDVTIFGGTNGIKAKDGSVNFNGGTIHIAGGTKEEKHSIYAAVFNYTGGTVFAAGNKFTAPSTSAAPYVGFGFKNGGTADSELVFYVNGKEKGRLTPHKDFMSAVMFLPDLKEGDTVSVSVDGKSSGDFKISGTKNEFTVE
ncbi:MAG: carbohydrate-binding domain-containing protein [Ruminococcus sp.]|nr:carbohydrate-binding domain-containing protein [Ruminococcus sp.]